MHVKIIIFTLRFVEYHRQLLHVLVLTLLLKILDVLVKHMIGIVTLQFQPNHCEWVPSLAALVNCDLTCIRPKHHDSHR